MPQEFQTVFVCSTSKDLSGYREAVRQIITRLDLYPIIMEAFNPGQRDAMQRCYDEVQRADIFVGIYAHRYGYCPTSNATYTTIDGETRACPGDQSITHMEYDWAIEKGIPVCLFVLAENDPDGEPLDWPVDCIDEDHQPMQDLKSTIMGKHVVAFFHSTDDLAARVATALPAVLNKTQPATVFYRPLDPPPTGTRPDPGPLPPGSRLPFPRNEFFTGREAELDELVAGLLDGAGQPHAIATGYGGIGKSQLAIEFAHRYGRFFQGVHWVSALSGDVQDEIANCGRMMGLQLPKELDEQVAQTLQAWRAGGSRLIIIDNAEHPADIVKTWLPRFGGNAVLITSRNPKWPRGMGLKLMHLDAMSQDEACELLRKLAPRLAAEPDAELDAIGEALGYLPLALDLVGRYLDDIPDLSPAGYLVDVAKRGSLAQTALDDWHDDGIMLTPQQVNVTATFLLSWDRLDDDHPEHTLAMRVFRGCGYCATNTPIPRQLLRDAYTVEQENAPSVDKALKHLIAIGLLRPAEVGEPGPSIHPLLAEFARMQDAKVAEDTRALAVLVMTLEAATDQAFATGLMQESLPWLPHIEAMAPLAETAGHKNAGALWNNLGYYHYHMVGDYDGARDAYQRALHIDEPVFGPDHPDVALRLNNLGLAYKDMGDYPTAAHILQRALRIWEDAYDSDHPQSSHRNQQPGVGV